MTNMLLCLSFLSDIGNIILGSLIAIAVIVCLVIMLKYKESRKFLGYTLGCILIVIGILSTISFVKETNKESYINGSIDITNKFSQESFSYSATSVVFYDDVYDETDTYYFEIDLLKVDNFDGEKKEYQVFMNDYELFESEINAGSIYSTVTMDFDDTNGDQIQTAELNISIQFLNSKTSLSLSTEGIESASYLEQYFLDNGFTLKVIEILEG